ncbi:MAG: thiamine pyrophosphate-dependent enzyme, partial [Gemmatimonadaceae bacterium]
ADWENQLSSRRDTDRFPFTLQRPLAALRRVMDRSGIVLVGSGNTQGAVKQTFPVYEPRTHLTTGGFSSMGWPVPAALGAKLAAPGRQVASITGDGDFLMTAQEIGVCAQHGIPVCFVVQNNAGYMSIRGGQRKIMDRHVLSEWSRDGEAYHVDCTALAGAFGAEPTPLVIRFFPVLAGAVAALAAAATARRIAGPRAALFAALAFAIMPLAAAGLVLATPDSPLLCFEALAVFSVVRALGHPPRSTASLGWWSAAGVCLGLAFASKYTSILLPLSMLVAVLVRPSLRDRLREPGPYIACLLATLVFVPVLQWNATHDWISFRFQLEHGLGTPKGSALTRELDLVGGQLGLVTPVLFGLIALAVWRALRRPRDDAHFALAAIATGSWVFFVYSAIHRRVEANWPAPSYIAGVALLASMLATSASASLARWWRGGLALSAVLVAVLYLHAAVGILPLPARRDPIARAAGWDDLARPVAAMRDSLGTRAWVGAERYQDVSELAYHLRGRPQVFCVCLTGRHNHYELWPGFASRAHTGDALVLALDERTGAHEAVTRLAPHFDRVRRGALAALLSGRDTVSVRRLWVLDGYRGGWPLRVEP